MVKLKFIIKDNTLVLRISEGKERYYKSVKHLLTGSPNLAKHWNADKERFSANAVSYSENNKALEEFKSTYTKLLFVHCFINENFFGVLVFFVLSKCVVFP